MQALGGSLLWATSEGKKALASLFGRRIRLLAVPPPSSPNPGKQIGALFQVQRSTPRARQGHALQDSQSSYDVGGADY